MRKCPECPKVFHDIPGSKDKEPRTALQQFADHLTVHQPTGTQWSEAYIKIQDTKPARERPTPAPNHRP